MSTPKKPKVPFLLTKEEQPQPITQPAEVAQPKEKVKVPRESEVIKVIICPNCGALTTSMNKTCPTCNSSL